jgi:hypothetical protein
MQDLLGDVSAARDLEAAMWARFEEAAAKVGCSVDQIQSYFEMALNTCRPGGMRPSLKVGMPVGPVPEVEVLQATRTLHRPSLHSKELRARSCVRREQHQRA